MVDNVGSCGVSEYEDQMIAKSLGIRPIRKVSCCVCGVEGDSVTLLPVYRTHKDWVHYYCEYRLDPGYRWPRRPAKLVETGYTSKIGNQSSDFGTFDFRHYGNKEWVA